MNTPSHAIASRLPFFYGYLMLVLAVVMQLGTSPGQTFAVSAFTPALISSLDLTQSQLGLAYMLGTLFAAVPLSLIGPAADRCGIKRISVVVITALAGACFFASSVQGFYGLLGAFFMLRFLGQGSLTLLSNNTVAMWFRTRMGRVSAAMAIGSAIAFAWIPQWVKESIEVFGWRTTYQGIGCILILVLLPAVVLLFINRPEEIGQHVDGKELDVDGKLLASIASNSDGQDENVAQPTIQTSEPLESEPLETDSVSDCESLSLLQALQSRSYYILGLTSIVWAMSGTGVLFYLYTLCQERHLAAGVGSSLFKILGLTMLAMQLSGGVLADFTKLNRLLGLGATFVATGLMWLYIDSTIVGANAFAALFGAGQGMLISVSGVAWVRYYGREHLGSIRGSVWCGTVAGSGCGPLLMGWIKDTTGSYDMAIYLFTGLMLPLAIFAWFIRRPNFP